MLDIPNLSPVQCCKQPIDNCLTIEPIRLDMGICIVIVYVCNLLCVYCVIVIVIVIVIIVMVIIVIGIGIVIYD